MSADNPFSDIASPAELARDRTRRMRRAGRGLYWTIVGGCAGLFVGAVGGTACWLGVEAVLGSLKSMAVAALTGAMVGLVVVVMIGAYLIRSLAEDMGTQAVTDAIQGRKPRNLFDDLPRFADLVLVAVLVVLSSVFLFAIGGLVAYLADPKRTFDPIHLWGPSLSALALGLLGAVAGGWAGGRRTADTPMTEPRCPPHDDSADPRIGGGHRGTPASGLRVTCIPNPCDQHTHPTADETPLPYMWFYRTEVRNTLDVPLRITRFEVCSWDGRRWQAGNIMERPLTVQDFVEWYPDGDQIDDGVIPAGGVAIDDCNWHGSEEPTSAPTRWAFWALDPSGAEHYAEVVIESVPVKE